MLRHFFKLTFQRTFKKDLFHTLINLMGLAVGLAAFILVMLFVHHERNYDTFHKHYESIYRVICDEPGDRWVGTPARLGPYLEERIPEMEQYTRIEPYNDVLIQVDKKQFFESGLLYADSTFFEMFSFPLLRGDKQNPLGDIHSMVISKSVASKYFGDRDPIGREIRLDRQQESWARSASRGKQKESYTITAVVADPPAHSSIKYRFILPFEFLAQRSNWGMFNYTTYIRLKDPAMHQQAGHKIKKCAVERSDDKTMELGFLDLQPMKNMHFEAIRGNDFQVVQMKYIYILFSAAGFLLLLAAINYTNLSTAIAMKRSKEVALKKISGSSRTRIAVEFLLESLVFSLAALFLAFILVEIIRPPFNQWIGMDLQLYYSLMPHFIGAALVIGLLGGIYPALHNSRFGIMGLIRENYFKGRKAGYFRNALVLVQFGITSFLLISTLTFTEQLEYMYNRDLGYRTENIYEVQAHWKGIKLDALKDELSQHPDISHVTTGTFHPGKDNWNQTAYWRGMEKNSDFQVYIHEVEQDFLETFNISLVEGDSSYRQLEAQDEYYFINRATRKRLGWEQAKDKAFGIFNPNRLGTVLGVTENVHFRSLHHAMSPSVLLLSMEPVPEKLFIRVRGEDHSKALDYLHRQWKKLAPSNAPFMMSSLEEDVENMYRTERKTRQIVLAFTVVAIFISLLGLLGLATYISLQRTKEIGIRKVFGSSQAHIIGKLTFNLLKWVFTAFVIASPLAWMYLKRWLANFAYHIELDAWIFILAAGLALGVGFLSVILQAYRASRTNPVNSLRYE
mgnify:CR=1 FL=1